MSLKNYKSNITSLNNSLSHHYYMVTCVSCGVEMIRGHREYYCPKCGLVNNEDDFQVTNKEDHGWFTQPWQQNFSQTKPASKWVGRRIVLIEGTGKRGIN